MADIDECSGEEYPCDSNANCTNNDGSFFCTCHSGYTGDGLSCEGEECTLCGNLRFETIRNYLLLDIDECEMDNDCDEENGVCTNTNGSYLCSCKMGFRFNGIGFSCSGQSVIVIKSVCR